MKQQEIILEVLQLLILTQPEDTEDHSAITRYERKKAAYLMLLYAAGFEIPPEISELDFREMLI